MGSSSFGSSNLWLAITFLILSIKTKKSVGKKGFSKETFIASGFLAPL